MRRATISDLADRAGVSVSTIDRIMNGRSTVRQATSARVLAAAEALSFYGLPILKQRLNIGKPVVRLGFLLLQANRIFYRQVAEALRQAAAESTEPVEAVIEHMDDLSPESVSDHMLRMGGKVQALAVVAAEHARTSQAIEILAANGVPTYGLISELTAACDVGYVGLDAWRVGRTAAWAVTSLCKQPGRVGILVGNHRYRCQDMNESGFRSYCREHGTGFTLLEPLQTFEDRSIARDMTHQLLRKEPNLAGLYISGGGLPGVLEALRESGRGGTIVTLGYEVTEHTRLGLMDGSLSMVLAHPVSRLAAEVIAQMQLCLRSNQPPAKRMLNFEIVAPESI